MNKHITCLAAWMLGVAGVAGCDLGDKDLGTEDSARGGVGEDSDGGDEGAPDGDACTPGDVRPADDGCNSCSCTDGGQWACTARGCPPGGSESGGSESGGEVCEPGDIMTAADGCNSCSCTDDGQWACTDLGCPDEPEEPEDPFSTDQIVVCPDDVRLDALWIDGAAVEGDSLVVTVSNSGGCSQHLYGLCYTGEWLESSPVQIVAMIPHNANNDMCDAVITQELTFDLTPLSATYEDLYQSSEGTISINLQEHVGELLYEF